MSRWYRAYEGTVTDAKLAEVALIAGCSRSVAIAAWHAVLENGATLNDGGRIDIPSRRVAAVLCEPFDVIETVFLGFETVGLIHNSTIVAWAKRQFESDDSKERVRRHREKRKQKQPDNADVTPRNGDVTPPETETETEKKVSVSDDTDGQAADEILLPEHVVDEWNQVASRLAKPRVRDMTPERRVLIRARIAQYSIDDFTDVFRKVERSPFLRGDSGGWSGCTFDWIMKKANFQKILEGNYDQ